MDYTDEQRRETLLSQTEDVAREDQIILQEGFGVVQSVTTKDLFDEQGVNLTEKMRDALDAKLERTVMKINSYEWMEAHKDKSIAVKVFQEALQKKRSRDS